MCFTVHVELRVQPPVPVLSFFHVLVRVTIAVMEHYDQRNLGRKDLFSLIFYVIVHQLWKSRQKLKQSEGHGGKGSCRHHRGVLITGIFPMIF